MRPGGRRNGQPGRASFGKRNGRLAAVVERNEEGCDYGFVPCGRVVSDNSFIVSDICFSI